MTVAERLSSIRTRIADAARAAGRDPSEIQLVAVSKRHPAAAIEEAYAAGQRAFGENYAQEFASKAKELAHLPLLEWHFIGHLQTNKVKLLDGCHAIHSIDSLHLAAAIEKRHTGAKLNALVEINLGGEESKSGCKEADAIAIVRYLRTTTHLKFSGFMTMPPAGDLQRAKTIFSRLAAIGRNVAETGEIVELSMGMSEDLEVAIAAGATYVRVGTAIFGPR